MAAVVPDIISTAVGGVEQYEKEAMNIVFSLPELTLKQQAELLMDSVQPGSDEITLEVAKQAVTNARRTF